MLKISNDPLGSGIRGPGIPNESWAIFEKKITIKINKTERHVLEGFMGHILQHLGIGAVSPLTLPEYSLQIWVVNNHYEQGLGVDRIFLVTRTTGHVSIIGMYKHITLFTF